MISMKTGKMWKMRKWKMKNWMKEQTMPINTLIMVNHILMKMTILMMRLFIDTKHNPTTENIEKKKIVNILIKFFKILKYIHRNLITSCGMIFSRCSILTELSPSFEAWLAVLHIISTVKERTTSSMAEMLSALNRSLGSELFSFIISWITPWTWKKNH